MKNLVFAFIAFFSLSAHAGLNQQGEVTLDTRAFTCLSEQGPLAFVVNRSTNTIQFSDIGAFGHANMVKGTALGATFAAKTVHFEYDWYFTANYDLTFSPELALLKDGDSAIVQLTGDDDDGSLLDLTLNCRAI